MDGKSVTHQSARRGTPDLRFIHYNDVYHVEAGSREPVGGWARFQTVCNHYRSHAAYKDYPTLLTLFSGDAFNPSLESSVTKGAHMVPVLNHVGTDVACVGNHDLDFGVPKFSELAAQCTFPWLLANVLDPALGEDVPLGNARPTVLLTGSNGIKIGVIGLAEREWLDTINSLPPNLIYRSASATAIEWAPRLRAQGADIVIALTHQREPNDTKLARNVPHDAVDLILGGHDHFYGHSIINDTHVLRSGTDFKQLSYIEAWRRESSEGWDFTIHRHDIVRSIVEDAEAALVVAGLSNKLKSKLEKPIGYTAAPLDARFTTVRLRESNYGNLVCDIMRLYYGADCALMAAGTIRGDQIYPPGVLRLKDIMNCYPFEDPVVVVRVSGSDLREALENGVWTYPAQEGRFPQVSNIRLTFDAALPPGKRVKEISVGGNSLDDTKKYLVATRDYMARGKDGFKSLLYAENGGSAETIVSEENGILISMLLRQYFTSLRVVTMMQQIQRESQWQAKEQIGHPYSEANSDMNAHWTKIHGALHKAHPLKYSSLPVAPQNDKIHVAQSQIGGRRATIYTEQTGHSDSEDEIGDTELSQLTASTPIATQVAHAQFSSDDRKGHLVRTTLRHWRRITRIHRHPECAHEEEEETGADSAWTTGVAPRVEGRIIILNAEA